ncbi:MAG TPA: amino acid ABC transporter permease [Candidatus Dormibacteraeota bacterium]|nr:amino acid ABC transporter permease [Candidatus Dormibacteraeota bacterium]
MAHTYNWNWSVLFQHPYLGWLISGAEVSLALAACMWVLAFTLGSLVGVASTLPNRYVRALAAAYVEVLRNIPPIVQIFVWYFVVPQLLPPALGMYVKRDLPHSAFWTAVVGLGLFISARVAEHVRAGIEAIPRSLVQASLATGLSAAQSYRHVRLPIAYRNIVPVLTSEFLICFKVSAIALTIGVMEMTAQSRQVEFYTAHGIEAFTAATLFYLVFSAIFSVGTTFAERAMRIRG